MEKVTGTQVGGRWVQGLGKKNLGTRVRERERERETYEREGEWGGRGGEGGSHIRALLSISTTF